MSVLTHQRALIYMHIAALLFGLTGIFGKLASAAPDVIVLGRALFAVLALLVFARFYRRSLIKGLNSQRLIQLGVCGLLLGAHWITFFHAIDLSGVGIATLGFASFPAFVVLLEWVLWQEKPSRLDLLKVGLVCIGLMLVPPSFDLQQSGAEGLIWALASGFCFAAVSVGNRLTSGKLNPIQIACWQNVVIALCLLPISSKAMLQMPALDWLWIALLGMLCTGVAHGLFVTSLTVLKARVASLFFALEPVYGILFAWYLFGEEPSLRMLLGGILIVSALMLVQRAPKPA
ncbi:DMT family transporter [Pseudomonas neustonica]|uniref:DMT family transporter n=1 Tax=Pseudomonas neustonica TaxID=2487346 RepID=A0ABX9XN45_9PSED|nr:MULTISPECIES: DMT family transporter [Pseudomonas]ROZ85593.1 DMT family transporter [Pseudomonas sp. SSM44]ROZ87513.1 DMT family transporter [Pseudomonas neustonica]|tara:strand:- start:1445 stop:2311 length:867 start_codon:yes stop_codon:yes gene_type:complete